MIIRIISGAIVGGLLMFAVGAATHMGLEAESRHFRPVPGEAAATDFFKTQPLTTGLHGLPASNVGIESMTTEKSEAKYKRLSEFYRKGSAGYLIVAPRGENMMGLKQLGG